MDRLAEHLAACRRHVCLAVERDRRIEDARKERCEEQKNMPK